MNNLNLAGSFGVNSVLIPKGGPKCVPATLDFSSVGEIIIEGEQLIAMGKMEFLQGVFIDNADNPNPLTLIMSTTGQRVIAPANSQGYYSILVPNSPRIRALTSQGAGRRIQAIFYNVPIQAQVWKTQ